MNAFRYHGLGAGAAVLLFSVLGRGAEEPAAPSDATPPAAIPAVPGTRSEPTSPAEPVFTSRIHDEAVKPGDREVTAAVVWMLRAAVSDLTCSPLEGSLGRFRGEWATQHADEPAVRREWGRPVETTEPAAAISPNGLRVRAGTRVARFLEQPAGG